MARRKFKWKFAIFLHLILLSVFTKSLPIRVTLPTITTTDTSFKNLAVPEVIEENNIHVPELVKSTEHVQVVDSFNDVSNSSRILRNIRPGQTVVDYNIDITVNGNSFNGIALITLRLSAETIEDVIAFHAVDLDINSVQVSILQSQFPSDADFWVDDGVLEIEPPNPASLLTVTIEYSGQIDIGDGAFYRGTYDDNTYVAMNLHPTNARRVFPCVDELTEVVTMSFTFNNLEYNNIFANTMLEDNSQNEFRPLLGAPHLFGMIAHNLININVIPALNVFLYGRQYVGNLESQASIAITSYFNSLEEWTAKPFAEIFQDQDGRLNILAVPDVSRDWYALSTICIWEPYIFMETSHSIKQRKDGIVKIAQAMARQWFGYVIYPENWQYQWIIEGLGSYTAYEIMKSFQQNVIQDITLIDGNTIFVTDVIQESLLLDASIASIPLEPGDVIYDEEVIRHQINGLIKYKAPAIMRMLRLVLGDEENDFIQLASQALLNSRSLETVNAQFFYDSLNSNWLSYPNKMIEDVIEFLEPWVKNTGYPLVHVGWRQGGVLVTQERFGFNAEMQQLNFLVPLTYTRSNDINFDNVYPVAMMEGTTTLNMVLDEEDWVVFNIQGQGYYRVNYDNELWERLIEALYDPDRRQEIHPLNRATLVDDALNLARAGKLDYEIAFEVVLSMEHETEYAVWKAFVRNMNFLRKRLVALVSDEDLELDPDIYLRMVRRTIGTFENEIGFTPDIQLIEGAMSSLTRGLVMDHACRANYQPCIAAAIDWFYDPNSSDRIVNPDIPNEIRPAVYCTMVREGDNQVISALYERLEIEATQYERVVILESLACSRDNDFVRTLLEETIAVNSPYMLEERSRIFKAVAESSFENAGIALNFMAMRTNEIRNRYGGPEKLEELIFVLADNMADDGLSSDFLVWTGSINSNLDDSIYSAEFAETIITENLNWASTHMDYVYEWIDENDAPTLVASLVLLVLSFMVTLFNQ